MCEAKKPPQNRLCEGRGDPPEGSWGCPAPEEPLQPRELWGPRLETELGVRGPPGCSGVEPRGAVSPPGAGPGSEAGRALAEHPRDTPFWGPPLLGQADRFAPPGYLAPPRRLPEQSGVQGQHLRWG